MSCVLLFIYLLSLINHGASYVDMMIPDRKYAFDMKLYEEVLDSDLCDAHIDYLRNNSQLLLEFLDAGIRTPRGIFTGNFMDLGNYYQCLALHRSSEVGAISGKYCLMNIPLSQGNLTLPELSQFPERLEIPLPDTPWFELGTNTRMISQDTVRRWKLYQRMKILKTSVTVEPESLSGLSLNLAVCIPKTCTTHEAFTKLLFNASAIGLEASENYCRLPNDKPWVAADYVAIVMFSIIAILTVISTSYDVRHTIFLERDPKQANKLLQSFSLYTNTRRLVTYTPVPGVLECLDGVRAFAMMWVILGHTFVNQLTDMMANPLDAQEWILSFRSVWITAGPITVDTFFMLSGLLVVYSTSGKMTRMKLLKNLHLFYLNRLLRMFPVLAAFILLQASVLNWISDGPYWDSVVEQTHRCRVFWWSTLLHIQNFYNPSHMCLPHSWYLAIDVQLHIISPLILFWVLGGRRRTAWLAMSAGLLAFLTGSTIYNFYMKFPSGPVVLSRLPEQPRYLSYYYINTLTRASPFFVGMMYGYVLHIYRGQKVLLSKMQSTILWISALVISSLVIYSTYQIMQLDWDNQTIDSIINSFMRPAWALAVGWFIFACVHGYGGPVNWVLSLPAWKLLSRLSYAMYIVHYPLIYLVNSTAVAPIYFSVHASLFKFLGDFLLAALVAFVLTVFVDAPFSTLIKMFMSSDQKQAEKRAINNGKENRKKIQPIQL
ncbi:hypothetical protein K1T71_008941 [Dendrolimus kikuchii]|uniref:Uncharacterized protein n=1 Tax=Dendrolimus kikuchii TaxID=765133 RepID=A0ACC1CWY3_9NEOP|nr:hypothetical protein K1T71_008941 [Dendrolimus kikuchii]